MKVLSVGVVQSKGQSVAKGSPPQKKNYIWKKQAQRGENLQQKTVDQSPAARSAKNSGRQYLYWSAKIEVDVLAQSVARSQFQRQESEEM